MISLPDILSPADYERRREQVRRSAMAARSSRRVPIGPHATLVFENRHTVRYQIQEMLRAERISERTAVADEIAAYRQLLPSASELAATLFIEYPEPAERDRALAALVGIEKHLHLFIRGERRSAHFDPQQTDGSRISAVQFVRFVLVPADHDALRLGAPARLVLDHSLYRHEAPIPSALAVALAADLDEAGHSGAESLSDRQGDPTMYKSPSPLPEGSRAQLIELLNALLADGLDLHGQIKVAHWNVKGPLFASLHPLFETFATSLAAFNDEVAERAVTLGGLARGTPRQVAARSRLPEYPGETTRDLEHVALLADRFDAYLVPARQARATSQSLGDDDTVDLFTRIIQELEKQAWFLRASIG